MHLTIKTVTPQRALLSIGGEVGFTNEEEIHGLGELMKASVEQVKLVVNIDGINHPPWGLSGRQSLLRWQVGVVHHGGNAAIRSMPTWPTNTLD